METVIQTMFNNIIIILHEFYRENYKWNSSSAI